MGEIQELIFSDEFRRYRREELKVAVNFIKDRIFDDSLDKAELKGGLEIIRKIVKIPAGFSLSEANKAKVNEMVIEDLNWVNAQLVRQSIEQ